MNPKKRKLNRDRRQFLQSGALVAGGVLAATYLGNVTAGRVFADPKAEAKKDDKKKLVYGAMMCGGRQVNAKTKEERFVFTQLSIDQTIKDKGAKQKLITDIGFLGHGVIKNPLADHRIVVFEKKGAGGCEIDLKENKIVRRIKPSKGCAFYGHGGYSVDGKLLYNTEYTEETYVGKMCIRDADDFKVIGEFPSHGEWPHDCQFIDGGKTVAITNGGGNIDGGAVPNVSYVEVGSGKLIEKIEFDSELINAGHLIISDKGDLAVGHAMREGLDTRQALGAISLRPKDGKFKTMITPATVTGAMKGETLSLCMNHDKKIVAATNPYGSPTGLLTFWNYVTQKYETKLELEQPRGVAMTLDKSYWVITFGKDKPGVILVSTKTNKVDAKPIVFEAASQGSHVYVHDYWAD